MHSQVRSWRADIHHMGERLRFCLYAPVKMIRSGEIKKCESEAATRVGLRTIEEGGTEKGKNQIRFAALRMN